ncbi:MAG: hypothetical protein GYB55_05845 [Cytophagales bacterium]|nr:hypothetical protein [Cytophagales bacterium]
MPQLRHRIILMGSLSLNVGRKTDRPCFRTTRRRAFKMAGYPACLISGIQESKIAGKLAIHISCPPDEMLEGRNESKTSILPDELPE